MSHTQISISSTSTISPSALRERCGLTLILLFAPAFPTIHAKGHIGPTAGNIPRRRRSRRLMPPPLLWMRTPAARSISRERGLRHASDIYCMRGPRFGTGTLHARYKVPPFTSRAHEGFAELGWSTRNTLALRDAPHDTFAVT
ncbi:hypothetical protein DFH08DRAFT_957001 [Mycena albidolilacea]|uniref:Uncharacterized protein n=1 Tax=Mycena albidolilacea TaxID=1033008 RepID=A0AAD7A8J6_9AGAR|nr:hypothetical protein DFH08DRAFT_957001 [Mycena albidolilacea]